MPSELWPIQWPKSVDKSLFEPEQIELAEHFAASAMRFLTLGRVGGKSVTIRPGYAECQNRKLSPFGRYDFILDSDHYLCACALGCGCGNLFNFIELPMPVGRVDEVKISGEIIPSTDYSVENGRYLVLTGETTLPGCSKDTSVTYLNGYPVDLMGQYAAGILASEYLKAVSGDKKCRLPTGVTSITRQGISMEVGTGLFPEGVTGITEVDTYVVAWNPNGLRVRPKVYSPDIGQSRQKTWGLP